MRLDKPQPFVDSARYFRKQIRCVQISQNINEIYLPENLKKPEYVWFSRQGSDSVACAKNFLLDSNSPSLRNAALFITAQLSPETGEQNLKAAENDRDPRVKSFAEKLRQITLPPPVRPLTLHAQVEKWNSASNGFDDATKALEDPKKGIPGGFVLPQGAGR